MIADDRRPYCDLRSAICDPRSYGNQPLARNENKMFTLSLCAVELRAAKQGNDLDFSKTY